MELRQMTAEKMGKETGENWSFLAVAWTGAELIPPQGY